MGRTEIKFDNIGRKENMRQKFNRKNIQAKLYELSYYIEIVIAVILSLALIVLSAKLFLDIINVAVLGEKADALEYFVECAMTLAVGVEFIKMLCKNTPGTVIEILLFAIARQIVVEHMGTFDTLIGVVSIAILFATRRFLFIRTDHVKTHPERCGIEKMEVKHGHKKEE